MPFLAGFGKRKEIRYGTVFPGANLTDFPKLIKITADSDIAAELGSGGGIAVTEDDGETEVPFGLYPSSDPTSGDLILRAKFPTLLTAASTGDVIGYLYYDAGETTVEDKAGVVDNGYVLFMPLEEDPSGSSPQMYDWVSESNIGTSTGSMTSGDLVSGVVGNGLEFDGSDDSITLGSNPFQDFTALTVEHLIRFASLSSEYAPFSGARNGGDRLYFCTGGSFTSGGTNDLNFDFRGGFSGLTMFGGTTDSPLSTGVDYAISFVYDGSAGTAANAIKAYLDGTQQTLTFDGSSVGGGSLNLDTGTYAIASIPGFSSFAPVVVSEFRVSSVARSADWLEYAYEDDFNNDDTFTLGDEEVDGGGPPPPAPFFPANAAGFGW